MASFTVPTWDMPYDSPLGRHGLSFPVSFTVIINGDDEATAYPGAVGLVDPDGIYDVAKAGSGEQGLAVFRFGKTYTITAGEETILNAAGYGDHIT
jgi:hypothetical protein